MKINIYPEDEEYCFMTDLEYGDTFTIRDKATVYMRTNGYAAVDLSTGLVLDVDPSNSRCKPISTKVELDV